MSDVPKRIVAEVSKTYVMGEPVRPEPLAVLFEDVIGVNASRGYDLESWNFCQTYNQDQTQFVETIIAVFVRLQRHRSASVSKN